MAAINMQDNISSYINFLKQKVDFKKAFLNTKSSVTINMFLAFFFLIIFPPIAPFFIFNAFYKTYSNFVSKFLLNDTQFINIIKKFSPVLSSECISTIGYRVEYNEVDEHLDLINTAEIKYKNNPLKIKLSSIASKAVSKKPDAKEVEEIVKKMMVEKQKKMLKIPTRRVGVDIDTLKTHLVVLGKTGSGKTEFLRSLLNDIWKIGGGNIFIDAKADSKMLAEVSTQLKIVGRETSLRVLNFLKPEVFGETNTINFFSVLPPSRAVEFLFRLADTEATSDGNHEYFQQRGKAMLTPIVYALSGRAYFNNEPFNMERLRQALNIADEVYLYLLIYGMSRDLNEIIKKDLYLSYIADTIKVSGVDKNFEYIAKLCSYFVQNPFERKKIENALKTDIIQVYRLYRYAKVNIESYLYEVWQLYRKYLPLVADFIYLYVKYYLKMDFYNKDGINIIDYDTFFDSFKKLQNEFDKIAEEGKIDSDSEVLEIINTINQKVEKTIETNDIKQLVQALTTPKENIFNIPEDAAMQHSYAQQQWTKVFDFFDKYQNIFGREYSEIRPYDLVLDNQILYVLFSPVEDNVNTTTIAKIAFTFADLVAIKALGGEKISGSVTIQNITKSKTRPKPIFIVFGDEYNSYALKNVDINFLQFRSLNISMILAAQTMSGLQPGKNDKIGMQNIMQNSSKYILGMNDDELFEYFKKIYGEQEVLENRYIKNEYGELIKTSDVEKTKKEVFDPSKITKFSKGFGIFVKMREASIEEVVFMQSIYRGGVSSDIKINNFVTI